MPQYRQALAWRECQEEWTKGSREYDLTHGAQWGLPTDKLQEHVAREESTGKITSSITRSSVTFYEGSTSGTEVYRRIDGR
jgi:hypothetical protein